MNQPLPLDDASAVTLVKEVFDDARELVRIEVELAKSEARAELAQLRSAAIAGAIALLLVGPTITLAIVAIALGSGHAVEISAIVAVALGVIATIAGIAARRALPNTFFGVTRRTLGDDVREIREGVIHGA